MGTPTLILRFAIIHNRPVFHGGRWGAATLEVCLAMVESAEKRKEIFCHTSFKLRIRNLVWV